MSNTDDAMGFLMSTGAPTIKFPQRGATCEGQVLSMEKNQQTDIDGKLKTFENGDPMYQIVYTLQTGDTDRQIEDDDGVRRLFAKGEMLKAIRKAVRDSGFRGPSMVSGWLKVQYTGDGEQKRKGLNPPKLYRAKFEPPTAESQLSDGSTDDGTHPGPSIDDYDDPEW